MYHCKVRQEVERTLVVGHLRTGERLKKAFLATPVGDSLFFFPLVGDSVIFFHECASAHLDFWRRERFFAWSIPLAIAILVNELASAIALLNGAAVIGLTLLGPLWMHNRQFRFLGRVVVGFALPFICYVTAHHSCRTLQEFVDC